MAATSPDFSLTNEQRTRLIHGIDADALERFLRLMPSDQTDQLLASFTVGIGSGLVVGLWGDANPDPVAALEEVWAPTWEEWGEEVIEKVIEKSSARFPGREIARSRLARRKEHDQSPGADGRGDGSR